MKFVDENDKEIIQDEVTDIFRYEDFLKETVLEKELGKRLLENFEEKYKKNICCTSRKLTQHIKALVNL